MRLISSKSLEVYLEVTTMSWKVSNLASIWSQTPQQLHELACKCFHKSRLQWSFKTFLHLCWVDCVQSQGAGIALYALPYAGQLLQWYPSCEFLVLGPPPIHDNLVTLSLQIIHPYTTSTRSHSRFGGSGRSLTTAGRAGGSDRDAVYKKHRISSSTSSVWLSGCHEPWEISPTVDQPLAAVAEHPLSFYLQRCSERSEITSSASSCHLPEPYSHQGKFLPDIQHQNGMTGFVARASGHLIWTPGVSVIYNSSLKIPLELESTLVKMAEEDITDQPQPHSPD